MTSTGAEQTIELRYTVSDGDPDQDAGSFTYNVTVDSVSPVNVGEGSLLEAEGGLRTVLIELGGSTATYTIHVSADDGNTTEDSCTVAVNSATVGDYDACGTMVPSWTTHLCMGGEGVSSNFDWSQRIRVEDDYFSFADAPFLAAQAGGFNLAGDSATWRWAFSLRSAVDGFAQRIQFFFSSVDQDVSKSASGNLINTASFANGWGVTFEESGHDYEVVLFRRIDGVKGTVESETFTSGFSANSFASGTFELNTWAGIVRITMGNEELVVSDSQFTRANMHSLWVSAQKSGAGHLKRDTGDDNCIQSLDVEQGGTALGAGNPSEAGQGLEDFEGQGGLGGEPMFPGLDVASQADALGMEVDALAMLLAGMLLLVVAGAGYWLAKAGGAVVGCIIGLAMAGVFNLIPLWILVIVFLLLSGLAVVGFGRRA